MAGQRPKRFRRAQVLATLNLLDDEDSGGNDAKDQENASDRELLVSEKERSSEDEIKNAPDLSATSDPTTFPLTFNSDQSLVRSNPSIDS